MASWVTKKHLTRRAMLRGAGVSLALPWLDAMVPAMATRAQAATATAAPKRFVAVNYGLGFHGPHLFPEQTDAEYTSTPYLKTIAEHRQDFTLISGLSHPEQNGANGHTSEMTILTSAKHPGLPGFRNKISIDQYLVERLAPDTRFANLVLNVGGHDSLSWSANGVNLPAQNSPESLFKLLFVNGSEQEVKQQVQELKRGRSILDTVGARAKRLHRELGPRDQEKFDQYLTSVRELESRIQTSQSWATRHKPTVDAEPPKDVADRMDIVARTRLMHDMIVLALQTDSTRIITLKASASNQTPKIQGVKTGWHDLSHHGRDEQKIEELALIEQAEFREIGRLLGGLKQATDAFGPVLASTHVMFSSNLGNASSHSWRDLPILLAGGGFKHQGHIVAGGQGLENQRLCNLFVQIAQRMGVETESFGSSDGDAVKGLG